MDGRSSLDTPVDLVGMPARLMYGSAAWKDTLPAEMVPWSKANREAGIKPGHCRTPLTTNEVPMSNNTLPSRFQIHDEVSIRGTVKAVHFTESKVTYEIECIATNGDEYRFDVPSDLVGPGTPA